MNSNGKTTYASIEETQQFIQKSASSTPTHSSSMEPDGWNKGKLNLDKLFDRSSKSMKHRKFGFGAKICCVLLILLLVLLLLWGLSATFNKTETPKSKKIVQNEEIPYVPIHELSDAYFYDESGEKTTLEIVNPPTTSETTTTTTTTTTTSTTSTTEALTTTTKEIITTEEPITTTTKEKVTERTFFSSYADKKPAESCVQHMANGGSTGSYIIASRERIFEAACDMDTEGGGWTIIQRRSNNKERFYNRYWSEYVEGFGSPSDTYWLGLDNINALAASSGEYVTLRIELRGDLCVGSTKCSGLVDGFWWGEWDFRIGDETEKFKLDISPIRAGNLSSSENDTFYTMNNGMPFSTIDQDNDDEPAFNCAQFRNFGAWWHNKCTKISLNGMYGDRKPQARYMMYSYSEPRGRLGLSYAIHPRESIMMIRQHY